MNFHKQDMDQFLTKTKEDQEDQEEEDEEEEDQDQVVACNFFPNSHSQLTQQQDRDQESGNYESQNEDQPILMDLSLRMESNGFDGVVEREHMFDKVVTPSDVGKLNRLVIPKQHAEKYFPLDSSTNDKGLILNFEDRHGKPWRFRYSYWNSSQSYVMTKGWSRFVKEKKLDAGDIVSFHRALPSHSANDNRLFIDWRRRRPDAPTPHHNHHHHFSNPFLFRWATARHLPPPLPPMRRTTQHHHLYPNYGFEVPNFGMSNNNNSSMYYFRPMSPSSSSSSLYRMGNGDEIVVNNQECSSMGIINKPGSGAAKRLRLFGVNMECASPDGEGGGGEDLSNSGDSRRGKEPLSLNWDLL